MTHNHNKIILQLMIKNESKIIERCLGRALEHVDAICILDTGSTDNTIELCTKFLESSSKPFKINVEPFKNFGYNRTVSFQKAQEFCAELGWDLENTYTLAVDADMIIKPSVGFKDFKLTANGYSAIQQNNSIKYHNMRFMRCSFNWKCIGVTHEYWSGEGTDKIPYEVFYIEDVNDGGCKSDKFERDIRLFLEDLKTDPKNVRTHFYLAQSYKDIGKFSAAIQFYLRRIELGGWYEEVWYSHYQISKCYAALGQIEEMEMWALKAFKFHPHRAEPLYHLVKYFREHSEHYKAYQYYLKGHNIPFPTNDVLFIEYSVYDGLFNYENTILSCYVDNKTHKDGLTSLVKYINTQNHYLENVWSNMEYYVDKLNSSAYNGEYSRLIFPADNDFIASSCSIIPYNNAVKTSYLLNVRYINYRIDGQGNYYSKADDKIVRTKNAFTYLNSYYQPTQDITMMKEERDVKYDSHIQGFEDVRLFNFNDKIYFSASNKDMTVNDKFRVVIGEYNPSTSSMNNMLVLTPPSDTECEKNWIYVPNFSGVEEAKNKMNFIYSWHPLTIGAVNSDNKLVIHTTHQTPRFFSRFRGSTNLFEYNGRFWGVYHIVKYNKPRIYYHGIIGFNKNTLKPESYSIPFFFNKPSTEYCLGFNIKDDIATFIFSQYDNEPAIINVPFKQLVFVNTN